MSKEITASMIKELRDRTGVGMGKCKEALEVAHGDMQLAIDNLRKAGIATAVKKEGRSTNEGMIAFAENGSIIAFVEVNAETDFVIKNDRFQEFLRNIAEEVAKTNPASLEAFSAQSYSKDPSLTIDQYRATVIQTIGENIVIKRLKTFAKKPNHSYGLYSHLGGKLATMVVLEGSDKESPFAKEIAMHVAAASPDYLNPDQIPQNIIETEKEIAISQLKGKPANIIEKILEGKLGAFYDQVCLTRQKFIKDDSKSISQVVDEQGKKSGGTLVTSDFLRWNVGA